MSWRRVERNQSAFLPTRRVARGNGGLTFGASLACGVAIVRLRLRGVGSRGPGGAERARSVEVRNGVR